MLPKSAQLSLHEQDCVWLRELALCTLAGASLFASDTVFLVSSLERDGEPRPDSVWALVTASVVGLLTVACLVLSS